jgi:hypothetical protein
MQRYYRVSTTDNIEIQESKIKQINPVQNQLALFIPFTGNHTYKFVYNNMQIEIYSPVRTNYSTLLGPLIFPIFPFGIINDKYYASEQPKDIIEIHIYHFKDQYKGNIEDIAVLLNLDTGETVHPGVYYSADNRYASLTYNFDGKIAPRFKLLFDPTLTADMKIHIFLDRVRVPSLTFGIWDGL